MNTALQQENNALKETVQGLERERDFYFSKLRDIELLIQGAMEAEPELENDDNGLLKQIQTILYSTEVRASNPPFSPSINPPLFLFLFPIFLSACLWFAMNTDILLYRRALKSPPKPKASWLKRRRSR